MTTRRRTLVFRLGKGGAQKFFIAKKLNKMWNSLLLLYFLIKQKRLTILIKLF